MRTNHNPRPSFALPRLLKALWAQLAVASDCIFSAFVGHKPQDKDAVWLLNHWHDCRVWQPGWMSFLSTS